MPVRKFRALPDHDESLGMAPDEAGLFATIQAVWALSARLCPQHFPPGVHKYRCIEDLNRQTEAWERETIARQAKNVR